MRVRVVAVGDELVLGDVVDTNSSWLARRLVDAGLTPAGSCTEPDDLDAICAAIRTAALPGDVVVVTGGLGPTSDDLTHEALAGVAGVPLRRDESVLAAIRQWYASRGREVTPTSARQADLPLGATVLPNDAGVAPGLRLELDGAVVYAVPGVPSEMRHVTERHIVPELSAHARPLRRAVLRVALLGEPDVAARLAPLEARLPGSVRVAYLASPGEVLVKLSSRDEDVTPYAECARDLLGDVVSGEGDETLAETVLKILRTRGETVAVAESLTGGLVGAALTDVPGASSVVRGGVVAYATAVKATVLGVEDAVLHTHGAVSPQVARAMASGVRSMCGATYGVATTGVAGPQPQDGKPVGTVHVAVCGPAGARVASPLLRGDRTWIRALTVAHALDLLRRTAGGGDAGAAAPAVPADGREQQC